MDALYKGNHYCTSENSEVKKKHMGVVDVLD